MTKLTKRYPFSASHRLYAEALSEEENRAVFGKCANPYGHGHNYWLEVTVGCEPDACTGLTLPRAELDRWVRESAIERIDHMYMNVDVDEFRNRVPTTENLTLVIGQWLREGWQRHFPNTPIALAGVRIEETPRNSFTLSPED